MKKIYLTLFIGVLLFSCKKDVLDRTIFIPDEIDPSLPAYTEEGYNSFGAEYERGYFLVSNAIIPCKISSDGNQVLFLLDGNLHSYSQYSADRMSLTFNFPFSAISNVQDLLQLNDAVINLSSGCLVKKNNDTLNVASGTLHFKRAQLLRVDDVVNRVILSGTFELTFVENGFPTSISNGRFDLGITDKVFYRYQ